MKRGDCQNEGHLDWYLYPPALRLVLSVNRRRGSPPDAFCFFLLRSPILSKAAVGRADASQSLAGQSMLAFRRHSDISRAPRDNGEYLPVPGAIGDDDTRLY